MPEPALQAQVGHLYQHGDQRVLAMESGRVVNVREINEKEPLGIGRRYRARAEWLTPLPMKYFHGHVPRG